MSGAPLREAAGIDPRAVRDRLRYDPYQITVYAR